MPSLLEWAGAIDCSPGGHQGLSRVEVMQLEAVHLHKFYKFMPELLHVILIHCGNGSYLLSNHLELDTSVAMKNEYIFKS